MDIRTPQKDCQPKFQERLTNNIFFVNGESKTSLEKEGRKELILIMNVPYTDLNPLRNGRALTPTSIRS
jgi:hypothetical protein